MHTRDQGTRTEAEQTDGDFTFLALFSPLAMLTLRSHSLHGLIS